MRTLCWSIRNCWAPGTTSWSLDYSTATRQSSPQNCTSTHRYVTLALLQPHSPLILTAPTAQLTCVCVAVMSDHVSGLEERPRATRQHLTGCLWVWHPSGHQGLQVRCKSRAIFTFSVQYTQTTRNPDLLADRLGFVFTFWSVTSEKGDGNARIRKKNHVVHKSFYVCLRSFVTYFANWEMETRLLNKLWHSEH